MLANTAHWVLGVLVLTLYTVHGDGIQGEHQGQEDVQGILELSVEQVQERVKAMSNGDYMLVLYTLASANNTDVRGDLERIHRVIGSTAQYTLSVVECETLDNCATATRWASEGLPQVQMFSGSESEPYLLRNELNYRRVVSFFLSLAFAKIHQPGSNITEVVDSIDELRHNEGVVVGVFSSNKSAEYKVWRRYAAEFAGEIDLLEITNSTVAKAIGVTNTAQPTVMHMKGAEIVAMTLGDFHPHSLQSFITEACAMVAEKMQGNTMQKMAVYGIPGVVLFTKSGDTSSNAFQDFVSVSHDRLLNSMIKFVYVDGVKAGQLRQQLGVKESELPRVVLFDPERNFDHFIMQDEVSSDGVRSFISQWENGELQPAPAPAPPSKQKQDEAEKKEKVQEGPKSAPIPENQQGPLYDVVLNSFTPFVLDETQDVFVEFYYPWCGHCKKLEPTWKELAESFKDHPHVKIAKFDMVANDAPPTLNIKGAPTLIFFPARDKGGFIKYEGRRELRKLQVFVAKHASNTVQLPRRPLEKVDELPVDVAEHVPLQRRRIEEALKKVEEKEDL